MPRYRVIRDIGDSDYPPGTIFDSSEAGIAPGRLEKLEDQRHIERVAASDPQVEGMSAEMVRQRYAGPDAAGDGEATIAPVPAGDEGHPPSEAGIAQAYSHLDPAEAKARTDAAGAYLEQTGGPEPEKPAREVAAKDPEQAQAATKAPSGMDGEAAPEPAPQSSASRRSGGKEK